MPPSPLGRHWGPSLDAAPAHVVALTSAPALCPPCSVLWSLIVVVAVSPGILAAILPLTLSYYYIQVGAPSASWLLNGYLFRRPSNLCFVFSTCFQ